MCVLVSNSFFEAYGYISFSGKYILMGSLQRCASGTETTESECREAAEDLGLDLGYGAWVLVSVPLPAWVLGSGNRSDTCDSIFPSGCFQNRWTNTQLQGPNNRVWFNKVKNNVGQGNDVQYYR